MATLLCFQKIPYTVFSMLNSFDLAKQLVLSKFRQVGEQLSLQLLALMAAKHVRKAEEKC